MKWFIRAFTADTLDVIHYLGRDPCHGYCGTFGYEMVVANQPKDVTCIRCQRKLATADKKAA